MPFVRWDLSLLPCLCWATISSPSRHDTVEGGGWKSSLAPIAILFFLLFVIKILTFLAGKLMIPYCRKILINDLYHSFTNFRACSQSWPFEVHFGLTRHPVRTLNLALCMASRNTEKLHRTSLRGQGTPSRTTDPNLDSVFVQAHFLIMAFNCKM